MRAKHTIAVTATSGTPEEPRFPRLEPFPRCRCGRCRECIENDRWDRIFARFERREYWEDRGLLQSPLSGL